MLPILLSAACSVTSEVSNWFGITLFVILASIMFAALIYTLSNVLPTSYRNKLKDVSRQEITEVAFSIVLVIVLIFLTFASCEVSSSLTNSITGNSTSALLFSRIYVSNLIFNTGNNVLINIYSESVKFLVAAEVIDTIVSYNVITRINTNKDTPFIGKVIYSNSFANIDAFLSPDLASYLYGYSTMFSMLSSFIVVTFGGLFVLFLLLPIIQGIGLALLIPIAIAMRSISFGGEHLRQASNSLIALAIGFYFILPLAISSNAYMVQWLFCTSHMPGVVCNPTPQYVGSYDIAQLSDYNTLFNTAPVGASISGLNFQAPFSFFGAGFPNTNIVSSAVGYLWYALTLAFTVVPKIVAISAQVSQFMLQGIVLIALDMGITSGFIIGIYKSLENLSKMFGIGPFWG